MSISADAVIGCSHNIYCFRLISVCFLNLKQGDHVTNHSITKKIKPHFFSQMKDGAFCFTNSKLPYGRSSPLLGGEASNHEPKKRFSCPIFDDTNL